MSENLAEVGIKKNYSKVLAKVICRYFSQWKYPVCLIYGNPDTGKTDTACLFAEIGLREGVLDYFASNFNTYGHGELITSVEEMDYWFKHQLGRKLFILDEAGIHDDARSPLSMINRKLRHEVFIIRKFKGHIIFVVQEQEDIDKWKRSELTGIKVCKETIGDEYIAYFKTKWYEDVLRFRNFPRTTIPFNTDDLSEFTLDRQISDEEVRLKGVPAQVAYLYAKLGRFSDVARTMAKETNTVWTNMQVKRELQKFLRNVLRSYV